MLLDQDQLIQIEKNVVFIDWVNALPVKFLAVTVRFANSRSTELFDHGRSTYWYNWLGQYRAGSCGQPDGWQGPARQVDGGW